MKKPKVIVYDNDGMLMRGGRFSDKYAQEYGLSGEEMAAFFEGPFKQCLTGKADLKEELAKVLDQWKWKGTVDELLHYWFSIGDALHEDTHATVEKFRQLGLVTCLATNQEKYRLQYLTQKYSYAAAFDHIFASCTLGYYKHSKEGLDVMYAALSKVHPALERDEIIYWDDREGNVRNLNDSGFNGQQYRDYASFTSTMRGAGYPL